MAQVLLSLTYWICSGHHIFVHSKFLVGERSYIVVIIIIIIIIMRVTM